MRSLRRAGVPGYLEPSPSKWMGLDEKTWTALCVVVLIVLVDLSARTGMIDSFNLVTVTAMLDQLWDYLTDPTFYTESLFGTLSAIAGAFVISCVGGVLVGYAMWRYPVLRRAIEPYMFIFYAIPTVTFYPLLVVLLGIGTFPLMVLGVMNGIFAVIANAVTGFDSLPSVLGRLSRSLNLTPRQHLLKVLLPNAIPSIAVGAKLALVYSIVTILAAEFLLSDSGLGSLIARAYLGFDVQGMYGAILLVAGLALSANLLISAVLQKSAWVGGAR